MLGRRESILSVSAHAIEPDRLLVVATRRGLARLIGETTSPPDTEPRKPIVLHDTLPFDVHARHPRQPT